MRQLRPSWLHHREQWECGRRAVDVCEPTQFSVGVMCQFPRCDTSAKILARLLAAMLAANLQRLDPGTL